MLGNTLEIPSSVAYMKSLLRSLDLSRLCAQRGRDERGRRKTSSGTRQAAVGGGVIPAAVEQLGSNRSETTDKLVHWHSFCVMGNHTHETGGIQLDESKKGYLPGIQELGNWMRRAHSRFGAGYNRRHDRQGKVAYDRPNTSEIENDHQILRVMFYGNINPGTCGDGLSSLEVLILQLQVLCLWEKKCLHKASNAAEGRPGAGKKSRGSPKLLSTAMRPVYARGWFDCGSPIGRHGSAIHWGYRLVQGETNDRSRKPECRARWPLSSVLSIIEKPVFAVHLLCRDADLYL